MGVAWTEIRQHISSKICDYLCYRFTLVDKLFEHVLHSLLLWRLEFLAISSVELYQIIDCSFL